MEESNNGKVGVLDSWVEKIVRPFVIREGKIKTERLGRKRDSIYHSIGERDGG